MQNDIAYRGQTEQNLIITKQISKPNKRTYDVLKRMGDIILALMGTAILLVPMFFIAMIIKIDSKGPVFYRQERLGMDGKKIIVWKFRSMRIDAEAGGAQWAEKHDSRRTRVGKYLRHLRIDEWPQIPFNVLPGTLSFVGPRPERAFFYDKFSEYIDGFDQRLYVKQGITGLAQINGGYTLKPEEKIIYDLEYIENRSIWLDIKIMLKTVVVVLKGLERK